MKYYFDIEKQVFSDSYSCTSIYSGAEALGRDAVDAAKAYARQKEEIYKISAVEERDKQINALDERFKKLIENSTVASNLISELRDKIDAQIRNIDKKLQSLSNDYSIHKKEKKKCKFKIREKKYLSEDYDFSSINLDDVYKMIIHMGFKKSQIENVTDDCDDYGYERYIVIRGLLFNLIIRQEIIISCYIEPNKNFKIIGGYQNINVRNNCAEKIFDWITAHKSVLYLDEESDCVYEEKYKKGYYEIDPEDDFR